MKISPSDLEGVPEARMLGWAAQVSDRIAAWPADDPERRFWQTLRDQVVAAVLARRPPDSAGSSGTVVPEARSSSGRVPRTPDAPKPRVSAPHRGGEIDTSATATPERGTR